MGGSRLALIVVPVVVAICVAAWIISVFHADRRPYTCRSKPPDRAIVGGIFHGDPRQEMPRRDAPAKSAGAAAAQDPEDRPEAGGVLVRRARRDQMNRSEQ
jgi:hypothetical protein